jgi:hypothetical protein
MKKQPYAVEEKLLWYSVRIIKNDILEETEVLRVRVLFLSVLNFLDSCLRRNDCRYRNKPETIKTI